jgi:hypothetical protein
VAGNTEHLLIPSWEAQTPGQLAWRLEVPVPPQPDQYIAYQIMIVGSPGELVGLPRSAQTREASSDQQLGSIVIGTERAADFQLELRQIEGRLTFELTTLITSSRGSDRSSLGVAWYCPDEVEYPLKQVHWVGPAGAFEVPESGIDLLALGNGARVRVLRASDSGGADEPSH